MGWYSQSLYKWIRFSGAKKSKYCKTISSLPFTKCFLAVPGWLKKTFCWVLHSEDYLVYTSYLQVQNSTKWPRICIFHISGFLSYFLLRGMLRELFARVFLSCLCEVYDSILILMCTGPAHKIESACSLLVKEPKRMTMTLN